MRKENGFWSNPENIKEAIEKFIEEYGIENFNYKFLEKNNMNSLNLGLRRHYNLVYDKYPNLPKPQITTKPKNYYKDINNVLKDFKYIVEKYGCFPHTKEILKEEGLNTLRNVIADHGGQDKLYELLKIEREGRLKLSNLETSCKSILDDFIKNSPYIDNARSKLKLYGVNLQNDETKCYFEIDRYYINERVAVEIQGEQHYKYSKTHKFFTSSDCDTIHKRDEKKRKILKESNVLLIAIPYNVASRDYILRRIKECGRFEIHTP